MRVVAVNDWTGLLKYRKFVNDFEENLYLKYFPNENEREPFKNIKDRIWNQKYPESEILLCVEDDVVVAGCVSDYYPGSKAVEPIYLVVDDTHRNSGIARMLLDTIYKRSGVVDMYVEVDNPELVSESGSSINPKTRIDIYRKLGFTLLDIEYVQPPLAEGMDFERNLLLMCKTKRKPLSRDRVKKFLTDFYRGLDCVGSDEYRKLMDNIDSKFPTK